MWTVSMELPGAPNIDVKWSMLQKVTQSLCHKETTPSMLPDAFSTSTQLLISPAKCTINRLLVSMLYLITLLHSGNAGRRNVRFRKSHFSTGEILAQERERGTTATRRREWMVYCWELKNKASLVLIIKLQFYNCHNISPGNANLRLSWSKMVKEK